MVVLIVIIVTLILLAFVSGLLIWVISALCSFVAAVASAWDSEMPPAP